MRWTRKTQKKAQKGHESFRRARTVRDAIGRNRFFVELTNIGGMRGEILEAERIHSIVGGFLAVYNYYGYGLSERVYCGALEYELRDRGHVVVRELAVDIRYKGRKVAHQRIDMVIDDRVILETKATEKLSPADRMQLISYMRASKFEVGILLHFGPAPRFERFIDYPKREPTTSTGRSTAT